MHKNASVSLGPHYGQFVGLGRFGSASEAIRAGLSLLEERESRLSLLRRALLAGEQSGTSNYSLITSQQQRAGFPLTLELASPGLHKQSWVKISQIRTLSVERIGKKVAEASPEELTQVIEGLNEIVD